MSSASAGATHRKPTRRPGRKAPTLRPESNTSVTAGGRVVKYKAIISTEVLYFKHGGGGSLWKEMAKYSQKYFKIVFLLPESATPPFYMVYLVPCRPHMGSDQVSLLPLRTAPPLPLSRHFLSHSPLLLTPSQVSLIPILPQLMFL